MATIFHESTGLASIADDKPVRLTIPKFPNGTLLITKISGGVQPNYQILYSLGSDVFITAFNQRLSPWNISGIHIPGSCNKGAQDFNGEPAFVDLYRKFNIRTAKQPLDMAFNDIVVTGFFIGMTVGDYSQNGIDGYTWETTFLGRMTNLLENPDPIVVAEGDAVGAAVQVPVKEANLKGEGEKKDSKKTVDSLNSKNLPARLGTAEESTLEKTTRNIREGLEEIEGLGSTEAPMVYDPDTDSWSSVIPKRYRYEGWTPPGTEEILVVRN
jgi:hypothetical protein